MKLSINFEGCIIAAWILTAIFSRCDKSDNPVKNDDSDVITWQAKNSPYVMDTFIVEKGKKLIIEPGVTVKFKTECQLIVKGELSAVGTETDSIRFTTAFPDTLTIYRSWGGVSFDSCKSNTCLEYCSFKYYTDMANNNECAILCKNSSPTFSHCVFSGPFSLRESGGSIIRCIYNSSPYILHSKFPDRGNYYYSHIACAELINFINPDSSNPILFHNDFYVGNTDGYAVAGGGFLDGNYIHIYPDKIDTSLGTPVDEVGDGIFTTTTESCINVDGITNPAATPHF